MIFVGPNCRTKSHKSVASEDGLLRQNILCINYSTFHHLSVDMSFVVQKSLEQKLLAIKVSRIKIFWSYKKNRISPIKKSNWSYKKIKLVLQKSKLVLLNRFFDTTKFERCVNPPKIRFFVSFFFISDGPDKMTVKYAKYCIDTLDCSQTKSTTS